MSSPSSIRSGRGYSRPLLLLILGFLVAACSGSSAELESARRQLSRGQLDRAEAALEGLEGSAADSLRRELTARRERHSKLAVAMEAAARLEARDEAKQLRELLNGADDPYLVEQLEAAISVATDRAAESGSARRSEARRETLDLASRANQRLGVSSEAAPEPDEVEPVDEAMTALSPKPIVPVASAADAEPAPVESEASSRAVEWAPTIAPATSDESWSDEADAPQEPESIPSVDLAPQLDVDERQLVRASAARRDEAWAALEAHGSIAREHLERALRTRWDDCMDSLESNATLKSLERVAQDRALLDERREQALALIFDEDEYFYPYRPPECPPEKARLYWPVQRRVDELVEELREIWDEPRVAKLSKSFLDLLDEVAWCRERAADLRIALRLGEGIAPWIDHVPLTEKTVSTHEFAWDGEEARRLRNSSAARAYNAQRWDKKAQKDLEEDQLVESEEQRQVEITNDYRVMFGRPALAWNRLLQASSDGHSDYMAKTGDFGHYEQGDEARKTPFDRMRLVGYNFGISENCHMGGGSAQGAHDGWCKSSGHHRNLLMAGHTEMGSAVNGRFWTQNFGTDKAFQGEIDSWQD